MEYHNVEIRGLEDLANAIRHVGDCIVKAARIAYPGNYAEMIAEEGRPIITKLQPDEPAHTPAPEPSVTNLLSPDNRRMEPNFHTGGIVPNENRDH